MRDRDKTKAQLVAELTELRARLAVAERIQAVASAVGHSQQPDPSCAPEDDAFRPANLPLAILHAVIECLPFNLFAIGRDGRYLLQNATSREQYGNVIGQTPQEVAPNDADLAVWLENNRRAFAGERVEGEVELTVGGRHRHYYNVLVPIRHQDTIQGILGVNVDITARKQAEAAWREAKEFSDRLMASMLDGLSVLDAEGVHVDVNEAMCQMTGFAREELLGVGVPHPYWPPEGQEAILKAFESLRRGKAQSHELIFMRKSGERFPVLVAAFPVRGSLGSVVHYAATMKDISDRKMAEELLTRANKELERRVAEQTAELTAANAQLRDEICERRRVEASLAQSEKRFRNYFEQGLIGMVVTSRDKRWLEVNDRCCQMLGYSREELLASTWAELTHPQDLAADVAQFERLLAGEIQHYTLEKRFLRKNGRAVHTIIAVRLFHKEDGSFGHVVCLIQDITRRKQAEKNLRRQRRTLKHLLRASDRERQLIAYDIHDGLAQELAAAIMQFDTAAALKAEDFQQAVALHEAAVAMVRRAHAEARRLISGVRPPILDELGVVAAIAHLVHEPTKTCGPKIEFHPCVESDRFAPIVANALYRIAQEAIDNAYKHSQSDRVQVSLVQEGNRLNFEVRDWGIGFDPKAVSDKCFGLQSIEERTRLLDGELSIESRPGHGTCIRVILPVVEPPNP